MRKTKAVVIKRQYAGPNATGREHAVNRIEGGAGLYRREPCATCPWRKSAVGEFPAEAFRISAPTCHDAAMATFACHEAGEKKPATCAGFLLSDSARHNLLVRIRVNQGAIELGAVKKNRARLFKTYREMAEANGVAPDDPTLERCR